MTKAHGGARWRAANGLIWTRYDDSEDWVVYNPASGDLHLLTDSAQRLWTLARDGPSRSVGELASALAVEMACLPDNELSEATQAMVAFMDRAGLINPVS